MKKRSYVFGRLFAWFGIIFGYLVAVTIVSVLLQASRTQGNQSFTFAAAFLVGVGAVLNHGAWQALLALFDIADEARVQRQVAEETQQYLKDTVQALGRRP